MASTETLLCLFVLSCYFDFNQKPITPSCDTYANLRSNEIESVLCTNAADSKNLNSSTDIRTFGLQNSNITEASHAIYEANRLGAENVIFDAITDHFSFYHHSWNDFTDVDSTRSSRIKYLTVLNSEHLDVWDWRLIDPSVVEGIHIENCQLMNDDVFTIAFMKQLASRRLYSLAVRNSQISSFNKNIFLLIPNVRILDLSQNRLKAMYFALPMTSLWNLNLSYNQIKWIKKEDFDNVFPVLTHLNLEHNELISLDWLPHVWMRLKEVWLMQNNKPLCLNESLLATSDGPNFIQLLPICKVN